jgi:hypothetical protein
VIKKDLNFFIGEYLISGTRRDYLFQSKHE